MNKQLFVLVRLTRECVSDNFMVFVIKINETILLSGTQSMCKKREHEVANNTIAPFYAERRRQMNEVMCETVKRSEY